MLDEHIVQFQRSVSATVAKSSGCTLALPDKLDIQVLTWRTCLETERLQSLISRSDVPIKYHELLVWGAGEDFPPLVTWHQLNG
jgi:hypothetical protein